MSEITKKNPYNSKIREINWIRSYSSECGRKLRSVNQDNQGSSVWSC